MNVPGVPIENVTAFALVIAGACCTVSVKLCVTGVSTPFAAVNVSGYAPPVPAPGVPASVAVPSPLSTKVTPVGSVPVEVSVGRRIVPIVVTVKVPGLPTRKRRGRRAGEVQARVESRVEPTDTPLPRVERKEARQLVQVHAAEDADVRPAARPGPGDQIAPAVAVDDRRPPRARRPETPRIVGEEAVQLAAGRRR